MKMFVPLWSISTIANLKQEFLQAIEMHDS